MKINTLRSYFFFLPFSVLCLYTSHIPFRESGILLFKRRNIMLINITNLVTERVLPFIESDAIVGLANISSVCEWYLVEKVSPALIAMFHDAGVFPTLILSSGYVIAGSGHIFGVTDYAKAIEKDIKARSFTSDLPLRLPA